MSKHELKMLYCKAYSVWVRYIADVSNRTSKRHSTSLRLHPLWPVSHYLLHICQSVSDTNLMRWCWHLLPSSLSKMLQQLEQFTISKTSLCSNYVITPPTWCTLHFHYTLLLFSISTCFGHYFPILSRHYTDAELVAIGCSCRCGLVSGYGKTGWASNARNMSRYWTSIKCSESEVCIKSVVLLRNYVTMTQVNETLTLSVPN
jgi:hypothetical protein